MIFQEIQLGTSVIPHFHVIFSGQSISEIILIIQGIFFWVLQGHVQGNFNPTPYKSQSQDKKCENMIFNKYK